MKRKDRKMESKSRSPRFRRRTLRLTEYEESRLEDQAAVAGLSVSEYLRRRSFGGRPIIAFSDDVMIRELRRQGGLLKHNFSALRESGAGPEMLAYVEELLVKIGRTIDRLGAGSHDCQKSHA